MTKEVVLDDIFEQPKDKIALIDADILLYTICFPKKQTPATMAYFGVDQNKRTFEDIIREAEYTISSLFKETETNKYMGFFTGSNNFRFKLKSDKEYKGNRKFLEKPAFFYELKDYLIKEKGFFNMQGCEADDALCIFSNIYDGTIMCSKDKDILQVPGTHFDLGKRVIINVSAEEGFRRMWMQVLTGDGIDNITGIPGVGKVTAEVLLGDADSIEIPLIVYRKYLSSFGALQGTERFYSTYKQIKLLDSFEEADIALETKDFEVLTVSERFDLEILSNVRKVTKA